MLITVGVLFLLAQAGRSPWMDFDRTWPALLIVIGLILFLEHNASTAGHIPRGYVPAPPGTPVQGYTPPPASPGAPPQNPVVTPPPAPTSGALTTGSSSSNPGDGEVNRG
jgi:hypothetical protein